MKLILLFFLFCCCCCCCSSVVLISAQQNKEQQLKIIPIADIPACLANCNSKHTGGESWQICADRDYKSYTVTTTSMKTKCILKECQVTPMWIGTCNCPNYCYSTVDLGEQGECSADNTHCICKPGFGGRDCSAVKCPENSCSGHGECLQNDEIGDWCRCHHGYTGTFCDVSTHEIENVTSAPLGTILENLQGEEFGVNYPYADDKYGDASPFFNLSAIATINVTFSSLEEYKKVLYAPTMYTADYTPCNMTFTSTSYSDSDEDTSDSGNQLRRFITSAEIRLKGYASRGNSFKGFNIKVSKHDKIKGVKKFGLKTGNGASTTNGDSLVKAFLVGSLTRALGGTAARNSFVSLYIQNVFYGFMYFDEKMTTDESMESRYSSNFDTGGATLMTLGAWVYMQKFFGWYPKNYTDIRYDGNQPNGNTPNYDLAFGDDGWNPFFYLLHNLTTDIANFDVDSNTDPEHMTRTMSISSLLVETDQANCNGNNWYLYRFPSTQKNNYKSVWSFWEHDWDMCFITVGASISHEVVTFAKQCRATYNAEKTNPMFYKIFSQEKNADRLKLYVALVVEASKPGSVYSDVSMKEWYRRVSMSIKPYVRRSLFTRATTMVTAQIFEQGVNNTLARFDTRWADIEAQYPNEMKEAKRRLCSLKCLVNTIAASSSSTSSASGGGKYSDFTTNGQVYGVQIGKSKNYKELEQDLQNSKVSVCGSDGFSYSLPRGTILSSCLPQRCSGVYFSNFIGRCGCKNDCFSSLNQGTCVIIDAATGKGQCSCNNNEYQGVDCSLPKCPSNNCSGNGICDTETQSCQCNSGFIGVFCEIKVLNNSYSSSSSSSSSVTELQQTQKQQQQSKESSSNSNWREILFSSTFNNIAIIRVQTSPNQFDSVIQPQNVFNLQDSIDTTISLEVVNSSSSSSSQKKNIISLKSNKVEATLQLQGSASTRLDPLRKSYSLMFNESSFVFSSGNNNNQKNNNNISLLLESGGISPSLPFVGAMIYSELDKFLNESSSSSSSLYAGMFSLLWINDAFAGIYWLTEQKDTSSFLNYHFETETEQQQQTKKSAVALDFGVSLQKESSSLIYYQQQQITFWTGASMKKYLNVNQEFVDLINLINNTASKCENIFSRNKTLLLSSNCSISEQLEDKIDINNILSVVAIEAILGDSNHFRSGNSFLMFQSNFQHNNNISENNKNLVWRILNHNFASSPDSVFSQESNSQVEKRKSEIPKASKDPFEFAINFCSSSSSCTPEQQQHYFNPLLSLLMSSPKSRKLYADKISKLALFVQSQNFKRSILNSTLTRSILSTWLKIDKSALLVENISSFDNFFRNLEEFSSELSSTASQICSSNYSSSLGNLMMNSACSSLNPHSSNTSPLPGTTNNKVAIIVGSTLGSIVVIGLIVLVSWKYYFSGRFGKDGESKSLLFQQPRGDNSSSATRRSYVPQDSGIEATATYGAAIEV